MKNLYQHTQTQVPLEGLFRLPMLQVSPYFSVGRGAHKNTIMRVIAERYDQGLPGHLFFAFKVMNGSTEIIDTDISVDITSVTTRDGLQAASLATLDTYLAANSWNRTDGMVWPFIDDADINALIAAAIPAAPNSYQTIVSQTGTAIPAVTSGFAPLNTYTGTPTFTWARTSSGVYTLTASSAVFNVANGKTAVFISPLSNPLSNIVYTVTSTTVITFTTSTLNVISLLLGATATDALLSKTMIYVQTYA